MRVSRTPADDVPHAWLPAQERHGGAVRPAEGFPVPLAKQHVRRLHPQSPHHRHQEGDGKQDEQEMQVDLAGDQHGDDGELPDEVQREPAPAQGGEGSLELAGPPLGPPTPRSLRTHAAAVAEPHAHDGGGDARQPPPAYPLGQQREQAAGGTGGTVGDDRQRIPEEPRGGRDDVEAREMVDDDEHRDRKGEEGRVPAEAFGQASLFSARRVTRRPLAVAFRAVAAAGSSCADGRSIGAVIEPIPQAT